MEFQPYASYKTRVLHADFHCMQSAKSILSVLMWHHAMGPDAAGETSLSGGTIQYVFRFWDGIDMESSWKCLGGVKYFFGCVCSKKFVNSLVYILRLVSQIPVFWNWASLTPYGPSSYASCLLPLLLLVKMWLRGRFKWHNFVT